MVATSRVIHMLYDHLVEPFNLRLPSIGSKSRFRPRRKLSLQFTNPSFALG